MEATSLEDFGASLQPISAAITVDAATRAALQEAADGIVALRQVNRRSLSRLIRSHPDWVPYLGLCCRLSQERLKSALKHGLGTEGWKTLGRERPEDVIKLLDEQFDLVAEVVGQRAHAWTFADILIERKAAGTNAARTVGLGRHVENQVEEIVGSLGLDYEMRTQFMGRADRTAPCDIAIPSGGKAAEIVCAIKSFGSTGSKQTDAAREIEQMAEVRAPHQYVFAFVDGIGWLRRQNDLRRILALWQRQEIDGVFNLSMVAEFKAALEDAAKRRNLLVDEP